MFPRLLHLGAIMIFVVSGRAERAARHWYLMFHAPKSHLENPGSHVVMDIFRPHIMNGLALPSVYCSDGTMDASASESIFSSVFKAGRQRSENKAWFLDNCLRLIPGPTTRLTWLLQFSCSASVSVHQPISRAC